MAEINDLSITDSLNTARFPEGQAPSTVNDGARALEGLIARWHKDTNASLSAGGTGDAITVAANQTLTAYHDGLTIAFNAGAANTTATTLNVDSVGAKKIFKSFNQELVANDIKTGQKVVVIYDADGDGGNGAWQMAGQLGNAPATTGANTFTGAQTMSGAAINEAKGSDVAAAATINLDAATGNLVDVTGNTQIDAVTLSEGRERTVRFTGTPTIAHGASLALPGSANITAAAGDFAIFRGYAAGVVRCVAYVRASNLPMLQGKHTISVPASAMVARTTNGAAAATLESTTNKVMRSVLDFDASTDEFAQFVVAMPKGWNEGTVTAQFLWENASGTGNVIWGLQGVALSDDDAIDAAYGTAQTVTDGVTAAGDLMISAETSAMTIGGTPAESDLVSFQVYRDANDAGDTLGVDARLIAVRLFITYNAGNDA